MSCCWGYLKGGTPPSFCKAELKTGFDPLVALVADAGSLLTLDPGCWKDLRDPRERVSGCEELVGSMFSHTASGF